MSTRPGLLHKNAPNQAERSMSESDVVLYSRQGCHLCDVAADVLSRHHLAFEIIDIDADPQLRERFNECVPVVVIDGKERFRGRVDELLLRRILSQRGKA